jgi:hypothetical protein
MAIHSARKVRLHSIFVVVVMLNQGSTEKKSFTATDFFGAFMLCAVVTIAFVCTPYAVKLGIWMNGFSNPALNVRLGESYGDQLLAAGVTRITVNEGAFDTKALGVNYSLDGGYREAILGTTGSRFLASEVDRIVIEVVGGTVSYRGVLARDPQGFQAIDVHYDEASHLISAALEFAEIERASLDRWHAITLLKPIK